MTEYKAVLNYHLGTCTLVQHNKAYTLRPLSYSGADFDSPHCTHTLRLPPAPVAASARLAVEKLLLNASQCRRAIRQGESFIVMVNTAVVPHTDVSNGSASVKSDNTSSCAASASAHCSAPDTAFTLTQQLDGIKSQFADVFAEPSGLPPDRGIEHVIPLEPDAQPPFKRMYRLSPSELVEVKRQVTELLQKQLIEPSVSPYGAPLLSVLRKGVELRVVIDYRALNKLTMKNRFLLPRIDDLFDKLQGSQYFTSLDAASGFQQILCRSQTDKDSFQNPIWPLLVQGTALWPHQCTSHIRSCHEQGV